MGRGSVSPSAHAARSSLDGPDSSCDLFSEMGATRAPVSEVPVLWAFPARRRPRNVIVTVLSLFFAVFSLRESGFGAADKACRSAGMPDLRLALDQALRRELVERTMYEH